ncbi:MAG TPA: hypothetical protein VK964_08975 [Nocardioidaceae bacterium]|nr:hypothetical protein [Nocardioidaceae bacterium]
MTIRFVAFVAILMAVLVSAPTATAAGEPPPPPKCFTSNGMGELPTCTWDGQRWKVSYEGSMPGGFGGPEVGVPPGFVAFGVLVVLVGVALSLWRVILARQVARDAGMDPDRATAMALLSDDGLDATYLAANLRSPVGPAAPQPVDPGRSAEDRLRQLQELRDGGLVSAEEYDERRRAILDSL